ncbi:hypothetical protein B0T18DRAFT_456987 [Schizothecium vesticola]|uniref:Uncharacterized protein n=1 Tax=Schizothecium vesticola TaxID=314040 RepID=A0AA40F5C4_9PEZI|nr:hypothetical protein B0T18DRAFT_456987 [Schizothecium vesticola]
MKLSIMAIAAAHLFHTASTTPVSQTETRSFVYHPEGNGNANTDSGNSTDGKGTVSRNMCCNNGCTICPIGWYCLEYECTNPLFTVCCNTERLEKAPIFVSI